MALCETVHGTLGAAKYLLESCNKVLYDVNKSYVILEAEFLQ